MCVCMFLFQNAIDDKQKKHRKSAESQEKNYEEMKNLLIYGEAKETLRFTGNIKQKI